MMRSPATFRQRDVAAAIRAAKAAGETVERIEVDKDGKIVIITGRQEKRVEPGEWDGASL